MARKLVKKKSTPQRTTSVKRKANRQTSIAGSASRAVPKPSSAAHPKPVPRGYNGALRLLWQAYNDALQVEADPLDFAVELHDFLLLGITRADIRRLVSQGLARHMVQVVSRPRSRVRRFLSIDSLHFTDISCFVLTDAGADLARKLRTSRRAPLLVASTAQVSAAPARHQPHWDAGARELWLGRTLVKRFRHAAPNQERILCVFQEESWPTHIDDPLPPLDGLDPKRRLHDTVNHLNQHMQNPSIHFRTNGATTGVCWTAV